LFPKKYCRQKLHFVVSSTVRSKYFIRTTKVPLITPYLYIYISQPSLISRCYTETQISTREEKSNCAFRLLVTADSTVIFYYKWG